MEITTLILAGGKSRRFGQDKASMVVEGKPMIERVHAAVAPLAETVLVSVADGETRYSLPETVHYVPDVHHDIGALAGLHAGLAATQTPWLVVVACDMPYLNTDALQRLLDARNDTVEAVVAVSPDGQRHPLCAVYRQSVLATVDRQIKKRYFALHALLDELETVEVVLPEAVVRNINTPDDLANRP